MPDATTTSLGTNTGNQTEQSTSPLTSTSFLCTSCQETFQDGQEQRAHMKEPWHLNNIKRRIASLPPIPRDAFEAPVEKKKSDGKKAPAYRKSRASSSDEHDDEDEDEDEDDEISDEEDEQIASPFQCIFCSQDFSNDDSGFAANLEHMRITHGLTIPEPDSVVDMQSLMGYLATEVRVWHECLYCGATKPSTQSIQSHMRDKGHCLLNLDREPELLDFWDGRLGEDDEDDETLEQDGPTHLSKTEMRFASGRVVGSRHVDPGTKPKRLSRKRALMAPTSSPPQDPEDEEVSQRPEASSSSSALTVGLQRQTPGPEQQTSGRQSVPGRQLARREEMSISGVSDQQRQALVLAEKKAQRSEAVARRAREWAYARAANTQKHDQIDTILKMGKQNHKLLPR